MGRAANTEKPPGSKEESESPVVTDDEEPEWDTNADNVDVEHVGEEDDGELKHKSAKYADEENSSSDEERNTVGNVPMRWYEQYDHIGYSRDGERILRGPKRSILDEMLDPEAWRKVYDEKNDEELTLTDQELQTVAAIRAGRLGAGSYGEDEEPIAWVGPPSTVVPFPQPTEPKRRFAPSKYEAAKVVKIVRAIRNGLIKKQAQRDRYSDVYNWDVWDNREQQDEGLQMRIQVQAPKVALPGHAESYNPPAEYLPTKEEREEWENADPEDRKTNFLPQQFDSMRKVPAYPSFIKERFERCLDLYMATRVRKDKLRIDPEELIPKLPSPDELKPFPDGRSASVESPSRIRCMQVHPQGQFLVTGCEDGRVRIWEIPSLKLAKEFPLSEEPITAVEWCPRQSALVFAATAGLSAFVISAAASGLGTEANRVESEAVLHSELALPENEKNLVAEWRDVESGYKGIEIVHKRKTKHVTWHAKGDYFAVIAKDSTGVSLALHRLSVRQSQLPFRKKTSTIQLVRFHPTRPFLFVASKQHIRIYNLSKQGLVKKLLPGAQWISSVSVHPSGDHVVASTYDKKLCWFDLDLQATPYQVIRNHEGAIRKVDIHPRLPLFADASDDGSVLVFHGMVYSDLTQNALIVPLRRLTNVHDKDSSLSVIDISWHPNQPWLLTCGADQKIHLYTNVY